MKRKNFTLFGVTALIVFLLGANPVFAQDIDVNTAEDIEVTKSIGIYDEATTIAEVSTVNLESVTDIISEDFSLLVDIEETATPEIDIEDSNETDKVGTSEELLEVESVDENDQREPTTEISVSEETTVDSNNKEIVEIAELRENTNKLLSSDKLSISNISSFRAATPNVINSTTIEVKTFEELKTAIDLAPKDGTITKIIIKNDIDITEQLNIQKGQIIILLSDIEHQADEKWDPIEQPADFVAEGEEKQREVIEEARKRAEEAIIKAKESIPDGLKAISLKRNAEFNNNSLFSVNGSLTLGDENRLINIDGAKVETAIAGKGILFDVYGKLVIKNAILTGVNNQHGYSAAVVVNEKALLEMNGGRITDNESRELIDGAGYRPNSAGGVFVKYGGTFNMTNGMIDNNTGFSGGVLINDLFGAANRIDKSMPATFNMSGGQIVNNKAVTGLANGAGVSAQPMSVVNLTDGIIAGNLSSNAGGGITSTSGYIQSDNIYAWNKRVTVDKNYENFIKSNKSELNLNGGVVYKNEAIVGGGVYVDSLDAHFNKTMLLDNYARNFGGGIYVSLPPVKQTLENLLITENTARGGVIDQFGGGNGGGLWNCPTGFIHIGDGHTIYIYNNESASSGNDITFAKKTQSFVINGVNIQNQFYSHLSPVTKDRNIIKYLEDGKEGQSIPEEMSYTNDVIHLRSAYNEALELEAWKNATTFILGNSARNGGGIGSNANLDTPDDDGTYKIKIDKVWDENVPKTDRKAVEIEVYIVPIETNAEDVRNNYATDEKIVKYGEISLSPANNWESSFENDSFTKENAAVINAVPILKDVYNKDRGLPFTKQELEARGLKYLFIEKGNEYFSTVTEKAETKKTEIGHLEIERIFSDQFKNYDSGRKNIYLYIEENGKIQYVTSMTMSHDDGWNKTFSHELLANEITNYYYYGTNKPFVDWGEAWENIINGYHHIGDNYVAFLLSKNEDDTLSLYMPDFWTKKYDENSGFVAKQLTNTEGTVTAIHTVTVNNQLYGKLDVEKVWDTRINDELIPKEIEVFLLLNGEKVIKKNEQGEDLYEVDGDGIKKPVYVSILLNKDNNWKASFDKLNPNFIKEKRYSIIEAESKVFVSFIEEIEETIEPKKTSFKIDFSNFYLDIEGRNISFSKNEYFRVPKSIDELDAKAITVNIIYDNGNNPEKVIKSEKLSWTASPHPVFADQMYYELRGVDVSIDELNLINNTLPIDYYFDATNAKAQTTGNTEYNFYIRKDENGNYKLFLPYLLVEGIPNKVFVVKDTVLVNNLYKELDHLTLSSNSDDSTDKDDVIAPKMSYKITNYEFKHEIEFEKIWQIVENEANDYNLEVVVLMGNDEIVKFTLTKNNTKAISELLSGYGKLGKYQIKELNLVNKKDEEVVAKFKETNRKLTYQLVSSSKLDLVIDNRTVTPIELKKVVEGNEISTWIYNDNVSKEDLQNNPDLLLLEKVLKGEYRYELYELKEDEKPIIKIINQDDGSYVISYPVKVNNELLSLNERLTVTATNTQLIDMKVEKIWENGPAKKPDIEIELWRNDELVDTITLKDGELSYTWTDLAATDKGGTPYTYSVRERAVEGYTSRQEGN
ncbi:Cna B-type domain-containing protein, partial [Streptococcus moroccensis]